MRAMATRAALEAPPAAITAPIRAAMRAPVRATITTTVTVAAAMRTIGTPIRASTASAESPAITAAIASTALRPLETRTRIGANARKILTRSVRITRRTGFPGQKNGVILDDGFDCGNAGRHRCRQSFCRNVLDGFVVSQVGAFSFSHLRAVFFRVHLLAGFLMLFGAAGFGG